MLGKFEELVVMALSKTGPDAPTADIYGFMEDVLRQKVAFGALFTTLERLVEKSFATAKIVEPEKGAPTKRKRKVYTVTAEGRLALAVSLQKTEAMRTAAGFGGEVANVSESV
jgi:DNA-binding PadR family transcriptional regulator